MQMIESDKVAPLFRLLLMSYPKDVADAMCENIQEIVDAHTVDAVPVVRCKDCENSYYAVDDLICSYGPCVDCPVSPNFWCANGKRMEDAHAQD